MGQEWSVELLFTYQGTGTVTVQADSAADAKAKVLAASNKILVEAERPHSGQCTDFEIIGVEAA